MSWHKIWLVLRREYQFNFKRPSFLFTAFGVPLISLGAMVLIFQITANRETNLDNFQRIGYIDRAGIVTTDAPNPDNYQPVVDPSLESPGASSIDAYHDALADYANRQLQEDRLDAYFVIADNYVYTGQVTLYASENIPAALRDNIEHFMQEQIAAQGEDIGLAVPTKRLGNPADLTVRDLDTGDELTEAALIGRMLLPFVFVFLYFMATNTTAQFLMSGVVEEKENRLMEILVIRLRPLELLWGKLLGLGALALTQVALWTAAGLVIANLNEDARSFLSGASFRAADVALMLGLFLINFMLFSATMLGIGASVTAEAESRQFAGFFTFISLLPIMLSVTFFTNPNGPIPLFFTFFPLSAAVGIIMRLSLTTIPVWQIILSLAIQLVSVLVVMWLSAKVFRLGMLMYGKPLTPRALWRALREGRVTLTEPTPETGKQHQKRGLIGR